MKQIPHSRPKLGREETRAVRRVLASGILSAGPEVAAFEGEMALAVGRRHGVALSSGTAALHLALTVLGVGAGDRVALPSYVCSALLHAIHMVGAEPLLIDIDPTTFNIDPDDFRRRLRRRTKAVIVPHMFGLPARFREIRAPGVAVIEDATLAIGTEYQGRAVGSLGVISIVSFYATKMLATGEGGMVLTDRSRLSQELRDRRSYDGRAFHRPRFNYKMTDIQAALGRVQLRRLPAFIRRRRHLARKYIRELQGGPWELPSMNDGHGFYRFVTRPHRSPSRVLSELELRGVAARRPVYRPLHRYLGLDGFAGAEAAYRMAVSIPLYPALTASEADRVAGVTKSVGGMLERETRRRRR